MPVWYFAMPGIRYADCKWSLTTCIADGANTPIPPPTNAISYPRYDLLGYDITRKLIGLLTDKRYPGAQSDIDFESYTEGGGQVNAHIEVLRSE